MYSIKFFSFLFVALSLISCNKEVNESKLHSSKFIHVFNSEKNSSCLFVYPSNENDILVIGSIPNSGVETGVQIIISKIDAKGIIQWEKSLPDTFYNPQITDLKDGTFLINSYSLVSRFIKIDVNGNVLFRSNYYFGKTNLGYSRVIRDDDDNYFSTETNGFGSKGASKNVIRKFNKSGEYFGFRQISDATFGGKISDFYLFRHESPETYYFFGTMFPAPSLDLSNPNVFVSKIEYKGNSVVSNNLTILDPKNKWALNYYNAEYLYTPNNQLIISLTQIIQTKLVAHVYKVDENLKLVWDFIFQIPGSNIKAISSITECEDGTYLLVGKCETNTKFNDQPFACKISMHGKLVWSKIYNMNAEGTLNSGWQLPGGTLIMGGTTGSFGDGKNLNDMFLMKTDENGEL